MAEEHHFASAQPEKRLFISLLTRDISLVDAVLDLIDNSINSAIIVSRTTLSKPGDYISLLDREPETGRLPDIRITFNEDRFNISDSCGGISLAMAEEQVFRFGRDDDETDEGTPDHHDDDRLSVYGIGLKRAIFKIGDHVVMTSAHPETGFFMDLRVRRWERLKQEKWRIPISPYTKMLNEKFGTEINITELYPEIKRRIASGTFESDLTRRIARTYNYFLERIVRVVVNGTTVQPIDLSFGRNAASEEFVYEGVSCAVMAGIAIPKGKFYTADVAGWYIFCNGRAVAFADKTPVTGWGVFLPNFQPKHRPFIGLVFFTSEDPELLPWTTTKSAVNQESAIWQHALTVMGTVGKQITSYLDARYTDDGTEITADELTDTAGAPASAFRSILDGSKTFKYERKKKDETSIQFKVRPADVDEIKGYLGRKSMSNGEVGRYTFDYFLENVVRE